MRPPLNHPSPSRPRRFAVATLAVLVGALGSIAGIVSPAAAAAPRDGGTFAVSNVASGLCLDITGGSTADNALVQQWGCTPGAGWQQVTLAATASGAYTLASVASGKCIDVPARSTARDVQLIQYRCNAASANQQWFITASGSGYQLKSVSSGLCMAVRGASRASGAAIVQETCAASGALQFQLTEAGTTPTTPTPTTPVAGSWQAEDLDRGLISVRSGNGNLVQWRLLGTEATSTGYHVYRAGTRITSTPITGSTNLYDSGAAANASYTVRAVVGGVEQPASGASLTFANGYLDVPIQKPAGGTTPDGVAYTYAANDASVGDLDGDGQLEIVLKWDPSNAKDNSQSGYTGNVYLDAYELDGTRMWRLDLGRNIRAGAHYTQFQVYDYDGDGRAEVALKTADGTRSGTGQTIGSASADHRSSAGYVLAGPEFLTMFEGRTGAILSTVDYVPARGTVSSWGDSYGNRVDRFLAGTAYLDGQRPSLVMARGYYTRSVVVAWDFRDGTLQRRWTFDSGSSTNSGTAGQGNHSLSVADVDADGKQEILYGALAIDDNGSRLWNAATGHGDAGHVGDLVPSRPGLEYFKVNESTSQPSSWMADASTGQLLWKTASGADNGRGVSADIFAGSPGAEAWSSADASLMNGATGASVGRKPSSTNFLAWWDGDPVRELVDRTQISKYGTSGDARLLTATGVTSNNGTKATPSLSGDLWGDWREEVVWPTSDSSALRIYATPVETPHRVTTLLHDAQYRTAIAWQNTAYNQPPHPSFFLGDGFTAPAKPSIYTP
ncbi:RICIN domain-containing protein [Sanguibacter sp. 25GB23B1]|uniref:rhamnogalacturonan lyase family protein n=1 Tax=unclassified Sanguibacter TaxID=2645534 RepID=UPI0032B024B0